MGAEGGSLWDKGGGGSFLEEALALFMWFVGDLFTVLAFTSGILRAFFSSHIPPTSLFA